jgi:hypothetical protein
MKRSLLFQLVLAISSVSFAQDAAQVDPFHRTQGGYGYLIRADETCAVWWAEGAYKVLRDTPLPVQEKGRVAMWSAKNEYESFIVVLNPKTRMEDFRIALPELKDSRGRRMGQTDITIRKVEYVKVSKPTDSYGFTGHWPDPVPVYERPDTLYPGENQPFWVTVKVPESTDAGDYTGELRLSSGLWRLAVPVTVHVWDFSLPKTPSMRSGFGLNLGMIKAYENLSTLAHERAVFDHYMESFRAYKISPYNPFVYAPIKETVRGIAWSGGVFDSQVKHAGAYAYKLADNSASANTEGHTKTLIPVNNSDAYALSWFAKADAEKQAYVTGVECYNAEGELLVFENRFEVYSVKRDWEKKTLKLGRFGPEVRSVRIRLFPSNRTISGEGTGTVWFDDVSLLNTKTNENLFPAGHFEVNLDDIEIELDFTAFNEAGRRYFDEFGFTGYRLLLKGLGGGNYYSRRKGVFAGFEQGTDEYDKLMQSYLSQMQDNLEKNGWLGKEYIYWFDEPGEQDYPFVRETNALMKKYAPKVTTFLTEHVKGQDISDVTDISCTIWHKLDHDKIKRMNAKGLEHWSYLCCWPKSPWISEFIDHDAVNLRMWLWASYTYGLKGILIWQTTYWNSQAASPDGYLQNPWEEAMSYVTGYGWPLGKQTIWGNGDGRFFYPLNRNPNHDASTYVGQPVPSLRLEILRDGIEDYEYLVMLEAAVKRAPAAKRDLARQAEQLLDIPETLYTNETTYSKNPQDILAHRKKLAEYILKLKE